MATNAETKPYHEPAIPFSEQRSVVRAEIGRRVGEKLDTTLGVWRLSTTRERPVQLYVLSCFLSPEECQQLCGKIDSDNFPSPLYDQAKYAGARTSHSCNLNPHDPLVKQVDKRLSALLGIDDYFSECLQGQRYSPGQQFRDHADFFYIDQPYWPDYEKRGGQRTWTAMIYLNQPERGGATGFRHLNLAVAPVPGQLLVWNNMALDGSPNPWTIHEGGPVEAGSKYIVTKWYRERRTA